MARPTAADRRAAIKYGPSVRRIAQRYRNPYTGKRLSGAALLLKLASGESGFNSGANSGKAQGRTQFTPSSRRISIQKYGVDPLASIDDAYHAASLHLRGKINGSKGLEGYNPGMPSYPSYILKQKVGKIRGAPGGEAAGSGGAGGVAGVPGSPGSVGAQNVAMGSTGALALLSALGQKPSPPPPSTLPAPAFAAAPSLPKGYAGVQTAGGPEPKAPDVDALLEQIRTTGGDVQLAPGLQGIAGVQGLPSGRGTGGGKGDAFVAAVRQEAEHISQAKVPYSWGGGHGKPQKAGSKVTPLDCSGAVSRVLGVNPRVSGEFERWGKPGRGRVTVYANKTHVLMEIDGHFWGTSASNPGGGAGWIPRSKISRDYLRNFTARHA